MIGEWANDWSLETPEGTLVFNAADSNGWVFQLNPLKCTATLPVRVTEDDVPQADGAIPHRRWRSGYGVHLAIEMLKDEGGELDCAEGADLVGMLDLLGLHVNAMIRTGIIPGLPNARLIFKPTGFDERMFDFCQLSGTPTPSMDGALGGVQVELDIDTPYPYYIEHAETDTVLGDTGAEIVNNPGNTDFFPVVQVFGPYSSFVLTNLSVTDLDGNPLQIVYDDGLPGASAVDPGDYIEITFFTGRAFLNGSGANRKAGIDLRYSDFFPLVPGDNLLTITDATALIKSNGAWA